MFPDSTVMETINDDDRPCMCAAVDTILTQPFLVQMIGSLLTLERCQRWMWFRSIGDDSRSCMPGEALATLPGEVLATLPGESLATDLKPEEVLDTDFMPKEVLGTAN